MTGGDKLGGIVTLAGIGVLFWWFDRSDGVINFAKGVVVVGGFFAICAIIEWREKAKDLDKLREQQAECERAKRDAETKKDAAK